MTSFTYNWDQVNVYTQSKIREEGTLRMVDNGSPNGPHFGVVAVKKYGCILWEPLATLSSANWMKYRNTIGSSVAAISNDTEKIQTQDADSKILAETLEMFNELMDKMPFQDRKDFINKNQNTWLGQTHCLNCLKRCRAGDKKKCVNHKCGGLCDACHDEIEDKCPACNTKQIVECPICQEEKGVDHMCKSESCNHHVCWECYGRAFKVNHPIINCPLCRACFTKNDDDDDDDYDSDGSMPGLVGDQELDEELSDYIQNMSNVPTWDFDAIDTGISPQDQLDAGIQMVLWTSASSNGPPNASSNGAVKV